VLGVSVPASHSTMESGKIQKKKKKGAGMENINAKLGLVMKSGKASLGYKATIKSLRQGKCALPPPCVWCMRVHGCSSGQLRHAAAKLVLISSNCPPLRKSEIEYYAMLAKTAVYHYSGSMPPPRLSMHTEKGVEGPSLYVHREVEGWWGGAEGCCALMRRRV